MRKPNTRCSAFWFRSLISFPAPVPSLQDSLWVASLVTGFTRWLRGGSLSLVPSSPHRPAGAQMPTWSMRRRRRSR